MLGFILSKMQMLLFATGIFVVALLFFGFVSGLELKNVTSSLLQENASLIEEQVLNDSLCSFKVNSIPERLYFSAGSSSMFYDFIFARKETAGHNNLILSIAQHGKEGILNSRIVSFKGDIVFIDPDLIGNYDEELETYFIGVDKPKEEIRLYPRQSLKGSGATAPDSYVTLKEVTFENNAEKSTLYIIPCSSTFIGNTLNPMANCVENILRVGCYLLNKRYAGTQGNKDLVPSCFDVSYNAVNSEILSNNSLTWEGCKTLRFD